MADGLPTHDMSRADLVRTYREYSDYDLVDSLARAKVFIQAARQLLLLTPKRSASSIRGEEVETAPEVMQAELKKAEGWFFARGGALGDTAAADQPRQFTIDECWRCQ